MQLLAVIGLILLVETSHGQILAQSVPGAAQSHAAAYHRLLSETRTQTEPGLSDKCGLRTIAYAFSNQRTLAAPSRSDAYVLLSRPLLQKSIVVGDFRIHYDTLGTNVPALLDASSQRIPGTADAFADSVGAIMRYVAPYEIGALGYPAPPSDGTEGGGPEYDIYILELGNLYGYTTPERSVNNKPEGGRFTTFVTIDNDFSFVTPDSNKGLPGLRVTLAHEFHHALQIGDYGYWTDDIYYYEMTSTWMEDVVFPNVNDYFQYLKAANAHFKNPEIQFTEANGIVEYSRAVWCHFIAKRFGPDAIRRSWEEIQVTRPLPAIDGALGSSLYGSSFRNAFVEWTLWNYYTGSRSDPVHYYPEGNRYPLISQSAVGFAPPSRDIDGLLNPLAGRYYQVLSNRDTLTLALANINLAAVLSGSSTAFPYVFHLNVNQVDELYRSTAAGIFYKLDVPEPTNWYTWDIVGGAVSPSALVAGAPFPNPYQPDGKAPLLIALSGSTTVHGTLSIFSSGMELVYTSSVTSSIQLGKQVISWNGVTQDGEVANSGVYFFVLEAAEQIVRGKFALIRK